MSTTTPPVAMTRPVERPVAGDAPEERIKPPVSEERDELDELPQGALALLAQLQPLREHEPKLSLAALRATQTTDLKRSAIPVEQAMQAPQKKPSAQVPGQISASLLASTADAKPARAPVAEVAVPTRIAGLAAASMSTTGAMPATKIQMPVQVPGQVPVSAPATGLPVQPAVVPQAPIADRASVPAHMADLTAASVAAEADADVSTRPDSAFPQAAAPLSLLDRSSREPLPTKPPTPAQAAPGSMLSPEAGSGKGERHYLQVPFSKGDASGLITVSKTAGEGPQQLLLSPSSASVSNYLSDNLAQISSPRWRLADQQGHEQGREQGHDHGQGNEQADEDARQANRSKREWEREA